jgi:hypothetical protein
MKKEEEKTINTIFYRGFQAKLSSKVRLKEGEKTEGRPNHDC